MLIAEPNCARKPPVARLVLPVPREGSRSSTTTSRHPASARCHAIRSPTIPPPRITTSARRALIRSPESLRDVSPDPLERRVRSPDRERLAIDRRAVSSQNLARRRAKLALCEGDRCRGHSFHFPRDLECAVEDPVVGDRLV